ncbi:glycoside hydrolase family 43 protein [Sphingomonas fuzhouensis]|uniref:glycoside hydrolase family 43 protein n=1 Tax=Sphingomonas fuzhouensis TaxID=3106033 RepID=UPI002AFE477F|nr:glycoside hydrolase family 43 protein [Sphingomonas sp. SGZ-02]
MGKWRAVLGMVVGLATALMPIGAGADNPIVQTRFTADPAPLVHDGVVYLYTGHDEDDAEGFRMLDWRLYSSTDMVNWTDRGSPASLKTFAWAQQDNGAWAPQVIARDGKFYLYAPIRVAGNPDTAIGVAVADRPEGPFRDVLGKPLIAARFGAIDPTVAIDDDGQAYLYWGNPDLWYVKLNRDMMSVSGEVVKVAKPIDYQEGPWFYKRGPHYYMAYASTCCPEGIGYAMSDRATGPWVHKGPIMDPSAKSTGNHPGIIDYKGHSYLFGFHYELNFALTPIHHERRSVTLREFQYKPDGTIPRLPWWDDEGVSQIAPLDPYRWVQAETIAWTSRIPRDRDRPYRWAPGVTTAQAGSDMVYVTRIADRSYIKIGGVDFGRGAASFAADVAQVRRDASISLHLDRVDGPQIGTLALKPRPGDGWATQTTPVSNATGVHDLFLVFHGGGDALFDFDRWRFSRQP